MSSSSVRTYTLVIRIWRNTNAKCFQSWLFIKYFSLVVTWWWRHEMCCDNKLARLNHRSIYKYLDTGLPSLIVAKCDPFKLTSPAQHASRWRKRGSQTCRLLHRPLGLARLRHRENRRDREFILGNSRIKLPARCMLGRRGQLEGVADWLACSPCGLNRCRLWELFLFGRRPPCSRTSL